MTRDMAEYVPTCCVVRCILDGVRCSWIHKRCICITRGLGYGRILCGCVPRCSLGCGLIFTGCFKLLDGVGCGRRHNRCIMRCIPAHGGRDFCQLPAGCNGLCIGHRIQNGQHPLADTGTQRVTLPIGRESRCETGEGLFTFCVRQTQIQVIPSSFSSELSQQFSFQNANEYPHPKKKKVGCQSHIQSNSTLINTVTRDNHPNF